MQMFGLVFDPLAIFDQARSQLMTKRLNQLLDMGPLKGERGQSSRQTLREGQLSRHAEVGQPFNFRHLGLSVWIISQDDAGEGVEAFHRTQGGIKVQNDGLFWHE